MFVNLIFHLMLTDYFLKWLSRHFYDHNIMYFSVIKICSFIAIDIDYIFLYNFNSYASSNAVDQDFWGTYYFSMKTLKSWWLVDLGENYIISEMRINFLPRDTTHDIRVRTMFINAAKMFKIHTEYIPIKTKNFYL